jgi:Ca2+-binding EF-hand superfamily protein
VTKSIGWLLAVPAWCLIAAVCAEANAADGKPSDSKPSDSGPDAAALFATLDKNHDGQLTGDEVSDEHKRLFERLVRIADKNSDGRLSSEEFAEGLKPRQHAEAPVPEGKDGRRFAHAMFERLDVNGDGKVVLKEVPDERRERFKQLISKGDKDGDGALNEKEFMRAFADIAEARKEDAKPEAKSGASKNEPDKGEAAKTEPAKSESAKDEVAKSEPAKPGKTAKGSEAPSAAQLFKRMDRNGDGKVTADEVPAARRAMIEKLISRLDTDGDKALSLEEFAKGRDKLRAAAGKSK